MVQLNPEHHPSPNSLDQQIVTFRYHNPIFKL